MLAAPGSSPRHIRHLPSPSPSQRGSQSDGALTPSTSGRTSMGPPPTKKPRKQIVLDEDTYVAAIEKIVERDFYPDIPKLQNRLEWLEAVRSGDPVVIRDAQLRIIQRRENRARDGATPSIAGTPATGFPTPGSVMAGVGIGASPAMSLRSQDGGLPPIQPTSDDLGSLDTSMSLDVFHRKYTSEDNNSFKEINEADNKKKMAKQVQLVELEASSQRPQLERQGSGKSGEGEENLRITDGFGTSGQPEAGLVMWPYRARNTLMYSSADNADAPLTQKEREERHEGPPKEVSKRNTRFSGKLQDTGKGEEETVAILYTPVTSGTPAPFAERDASRARQHYDLEDMRRTPGGAGGGGGGYDYVVTPSPAPGVDESPFMTWGDIEGTPLRLEMEDTPVGIGGSADGVHFKIPIQPVRDEQAHKLSKSAARNVRERAAKLQGMTPGRGSGLVRVLSPSPSPSASRRGISSPSMGGWSAAAQKLAKQAMAKSSAKMDPHLRATYAASTPGRTPKAVGMRESSLGLQSPANTPNRIARASVGVSMSPAPVALSE